MANEFVAKNGLISQNNSIVSGSLTVTQGITGSFSGSVSGYVPNTATSSFVTNSETSSFVQNSQTSSMTVATASYITSSNVIGTVLSASYAATASYVPNTAIFPYIGVATITGSLLVLGTGSVVFTAQLTSSAASQSLLLITGSIRNSGSVSSSVYGVNISPTLEYITSSQTATALRVAPTFLSGSTAVSNSILNIITDIGTTGVGSQFVVNDLTSGSIYQINTVSGLPLVEVTSDSVFNIYNYPTKIFSTSGSAVTITGSLKVDGTLDAQVTYAVSASFLSGLVQNAETALTASFITASGVNGPFGLNSVASASYASSSFSASYAVSSSRAVSASYATTASYLVGGASGSFTGSLFGTASYVTGAVFTSNNPALSASYATTASYATYAANAATGKPGGSDTQVQWNNNGAIEGLSVLTYSSSLLRATGSFTGSFSGSLFGTASYVTGSIHGSTNPALSASYALTASYATFAGGGAGFPFSGSAVITGSLLISGSGLIVSGSLTTTQGITGSLFGTASYVSGAVFTSNNPALSSSYALTASYVDGNIFTDTNRALTASYALTAGATPGTAESASFVTASGVWGPNGSNSILTSSYAVTASYALNGGGGGAGFPYTGVAAILGSLILTGSAASGSSIFAITGSVIQSQSIGNQVYGINITPTMVFNTGSQTNTAFRVTPTFSGSATFSGSQSNIVADFGAAGVGTQFSVTDVVSGSIYTVNDISGLPIIEALSDWTVNMYNFPTKVFQKTGSAIIISGSMNISGSLIMAPSSSFVLPLTSTTSPATGSAYWSGSFLYIYNGTKYVSASFA